MKKSNPPGIEPLTNRNSAGVTEMTNVACANVTGYIIRAAFVLHPARYESRTVSRMVAHQEWCSSLPNECHKRDNARQRATIVCKHML